MKQLLTLLLCLIAIQSLTGQTIDNLEKKKGFKIFAIGQPKSKYEKNLNYFKTNSSGSVGYEYRPNTDDEITVFDYRFSHIVLYFDKSNKLEAVVITKNYDYETIGDDHYKIALNQLQEINERLSLMFGKASTIINDESTSRIGLGWISKNYSLSSINEYAGYKTGSTTTIVIGINKNLINSGF